MNVPIFWFTKHIIKQLWYALRAFGHTIDAWRRYWADYARYQKLITHQTPLESRYLQPCLWDSTADTPVDPTYFYQDAWAFERIIHQRPTHHVDVGSHHKYVALLSRVVPVTMVDIRPLPTPLANLEFRTGSILDLPFEDESLASVSSMCVIEHIGLGRYGDPLDPDGTVKALAELKRVIMPGGNLYLSVPIDDTNRIYFNAHRAFSESYLLSLFEPFEVVERRYIYGYEFGEQLKPGFGTGCYHLRRAARTDRG